jgi:hypothetical protein
MPPAASHPPARRVEPPALSSPDAVVLTAGPLTAVLDAGELRWIRHGAREVLRGIYAAVREPGWLTVPGSIEGRSIEARERSFRVRFTSRHRRGTVAFDWEARIDGEPDGTIRFAMDGVARSSFRRNRIGLCVLHPVEECAGRPCAIEKADGSRTQGVFPRLVSPHQPFLDLRAIRHEIAPGLEAEVRFEGDVFEMEDQRNWSDWSFKTYSTPLGLAYPVEVREGARVRQTVTLRLLGHAAAEAGANGEPAEKPVIGVGLGKGEASAVVEVDSRSLRPLPRIGTGLPRGSALPSAEEAGRLSTLGLDHLRVDVRPSEGTVDDLLARACAWSSALGVPLEAALFLAGEATAELEAVAAVARRLRLRTAAWLIFDAGTRTTRDGLVAEARAVLGAVDGKARFAGGTDAYFAELNRQRPPTHGLDRVSFSLTPQVHAFDDATLVENLESLRWMAETARAFVGKVPLGLSPVTLRPRFHPEPFDPRQRTGFGAGWAVGLVAAAAEAGFESLTLFEASGPGGLLDGGAVYPVFDVLRDLGTFAGGEVLVARSSQPEVRALALRRGGGTRLLVANLGRRSLRVRVEPAGISVDLAPLALDRIELRPGGAP